MEEKDYESIGEHYAAKEIIDRLIERVTEWIKVAPLEYPEEWAELQTRIKEREEREARAAKRKEKRLNRSAFRKKSQS